MSLRIIGAGFGRTGTHSLKIALEMLGFAPCYHMVEVFAHPDHAPVWENAARGNPPDWHAFLASYPAAVDWPVCHFWRELMAAFPEAKVLLSLRDEEAWYASISSTILPSLMRTMPADPVIAAQGRMAHMLITEQTFGGDLSKDNVLAVYRAHIARVRAEVPKDRLIEFETAQGWQGLCPALGVPVPAEPYPRTNSKEEFRARAGL